MPGICGIGVYLPYYRIKLEAIAEAWDRNPVPGEKTVPAPDETPLTLGQRAVDNAIRHADVPPEKIGVIYFCSNSSMIEGSYAQDIAIASDLQPGVTIADLHGSPRSFTTAIQMCMDAINANRIDYGIVVGSDILIGGLGTSAGEAASEYVSAAGAGAVILGKEGVIAEFEASSSYMTGLKERWRNLNDPFPRVGDGRFIRDVGYIQHIVEAGNQLIGKTRAIKDYAYLIVQQPHWTWVRRMLGKLGVPKNELKTRLSAPGIHINKFGDLGAACLPVGLAEVLDHGNPGDTIMTISYGAGGSDAFSWVIQESLLAKRSRAVPIETFLKHKEYVNYTIHLKYNKVISRFE
ncbi:MAG: hypothetical protein ACTSRS_13945 [Candidatus Helarchaeota archaeon]